MFKKINEKIDSWWSKKLLKKQNKKDLLETLIILSMVLGIGLIATVVCFDYMKRTSFLSFEFVFYGLEIIATVIINYVTIRGIFGKNCVYELADKLLEIKN